MAPAARIAGFDARSFFAFLAGGLFGAGLLVSGMVDTAKVIGWLDVFGAWDPTLAFVLGGAVLPMIPVWRLAEARKTSALGTPIPAPSSQKMNRPLVIGSLMFGAGWGLAGFCPGPAMASFAFGGWQGALFFFAMVVGMGLAPKAAVWLSAPNAP
jgi:uncharacterized protein